MVTGTGDGMLDEIETQLLILRRFEVSDAECSIRLAW
jgi:hypothetical protein